MLIGWQIDSISYVSWPVMTGSADRFSVSDISNWNGHTIRSFLAKGPAVQKLPTTLAMGRSLSIYLNERTFSESVGISPRRQNHTSPAQYNVAQFRRMTTEPAKTSAAVGRFPLLAWRIDPWLRLVHAIPFCPSRSGCPG